MLAAAFFVTVVVALGGYHFFIERPRRATLQRQDRQAFTGPAPLEEVVGALPGGVFLQNGFTWSRVVPDGAVEVGVNPMLIGLMGGRADFTLDEPGAHVDRGSPLLEIGRDGRSVRVPAPVSGRITAINRYPHSNARWDDVVTGNDAWLCRIVPDDLARDVPAWMIGAAANEWTRDRYERIREHLQHHAIQGSAGIALADGGQVPVGALRELDSAAWGAFEATFLTN